MSKYSSTGFGIMGHSNLSQVRKYALSDAERARAGVSKL
jgi:hypothetical protein